MRLQGISDIETANAWLPTFIEAHNNRFATPPVLLITPILMYTILKRNWVISSASVRSVLPKISLSSTKAVRFRFAVKAGDIDFGIRLLSRYAKVLTVKLRFCMMGKRWDGKNMLMARSLYHWMMKSVHERVDNARFDLRSKFT